MSVFGVILLRIFPAFSRIQTECGEIRSVFNQNAGKWEKNADQNNSEYGHFLCSKEKNNEFIIALSEESLEKICFSKLRKKGLWLYKTINQYTSTLKINSSISFLFFGKKSKRRSPFSSLITIVIMIITLMKQD